MNTILFLQNEIKSLQLERSAIDAKELMLRELLTKANGQKDHLQTLPKNVADMSLFEERPAIILPIDPAAGGGFRAGTLPYLIFNYLSQAGFSSSANVVSNVSDRFPNPTSITSTLSRLVSKKALIKDREGRYGVNPKHAS
jgi:hypothetical protein